MKATHTVALSVIAAVAGSAALVTAGPLNPPAGPVASTYKTLGEVEPRTIINAANTPGDADSSFKITQPGSYYLVGNLQGASGKSGIEVIATGVTIDLNGFSMTGVAGSLGGIRAVEEAGQVRDLTIRNGRIASFGGAGIDTAVTPNLEVQHMRIVSCSGGGVKGASRARISQCHISDMGSAQAVSVGLGGIVTDCNFVLVGSGVVAIDNLLMRDCSIVGASDFGVDAGENANIQRLSVDSATDGAIRVGAGSIVSGCSVKGSNNGITVTGNNARIENCSVTDGAFYGISVIADSIVTGCTVYSVTGHGIVFSLGNVISHNNVGYCNQNGTWSGLRSTSSFNRIEDNHLTANNVGIELTSDQNFIVRNTLRLNTTPFAIAAGNDFAPVITNPGTTFTGATPWSNFNY
jgi:hypothetical protein